MAALVKVLLCRCQGSDQEGPDWERLIKHLEKNKRIEKVHFVEHLCLPAGREKALKMLQEGESLNVVVASCISEMAQCLLKRDLSDQGIHVQAFSAAGIREMVLWAYPGSNPTEAAVDIVKMAVNGIKQINDVSNPPETCAVINRLRCDRCKRCMEECPVKAYHLDEDGYPKADPNICRMCGICVGSCPLQVISLPEFKVDELSREILAFKGDGSKEPTLLVFACAPLTFPALQAKIGHGYTLPPNLRLIQVPCIGAVNGALITDALSAGLDGVILLGCEFGPCKERRGDQVAQKRLENLKETLQRMMFETERVAYVGWPEATSAGMVVDAGICNGCRVCMDVCPYNAVFMTEGQVGGVKRNVTGRDPLACRTCGLCSVACPSGACKPNGVGGDCLAQAVDAACTGTVKVNRRDFAFLCRCGGQLDAELDYLLLKNRLQQYGFNQVVIADRLCTGNGWRELGERLDKLDNVQGFNGHGLIGACSMFNQRMAKYQRDNRLDSILWGHVDLWKYCSGRRGKGEEVLDAILVDMLVESAVLNNVSHDQAVDNGQGVTRTEDFGKILSGYEEMLRQIGPNPFKE